MVIGVFTRSVIYWHIQHIGTLEWYRISFVNNRLQKGRNPKIIFMLKIINNYNWKSKIFQLGERV